MTDFLQLTFAGLSQGTVYVLIAVGFVAVFSVTGVINLAQGEFAALGGLMAISATGWGLPLPLAIAVALATVLAVAAAMERFTIAPVKSMTALISIILTLGVSTALKAIMLLAWGPDAKSLRAFTGGGVHPGGVSIRFQELWIIGVAAAVTAGVHFFYERTLTGKALRACSEQPIAARLVGISPSRASLISFLVAGGVGAVAGVLASPIYLSAWDSGLTLGLKGFVAATLGGLVSLRGAVFGGLLLGVLESLTGGYVSTGLQNAVAFFLLIVVLIVRPGGVFGRHAEARV